MFLKSRYLRSLKLAAQLVYHVHHIVLERFFVPLATTQQTEAPESHISIENEAQKISIATIEAIDLVSIYLRPQARRCARAYRAKRGLGVPLGWRSLPRATEDGIKNIGKKIFLCDASRI